MRHVLLLTTAFSFATLAGFTGEAAAEAPFSLDATPGALPKTVVPEAYRIAIIPDLKKLSLTGQESVAVTVRQPVRSITLNQAGLRLSKATLDGVKASIAEDNKAQTATLSFAKDIAAGKHRLRIDYSGPIPETPNGIYYDDYKTPDGRAHRMLVTQFEVADARRMFPGWDEPVFKATFQLTATLPRRDAAISNMPVVSTAPVGQDEKRVTFGTTPRMSTYLLALVAGDLSAVRGKAGAVDVNVWAPAGEQEQGRYALKAATELLPYYENYFGYAYPLPKLDLIAIPGNYEAGAMENWGAITFIDNSLLFNPGVSSPRTREEIFLTVSHEMSHQWTGDLVTMAWWNDIWLNEGFATWMDVKATNHFNPNWQMWPRQQKPRGFVMAQDALATTHPVQVPIHTISEANAAFDSISYIKGGAIIRMIEDWLGHRAFRAGMRDYIKAHAYGSTTSADLWTALAGASHKDVAKVAGTFTEQKGFPLVEVARRCAGGETRLTLTQTRFTINDPNAKKLTWQIPVTVGGPGVAAQKTLLGAQPLVLRFAGCNGIEKVNLGEGGYYRTEYDAASLAALTRGFAKLQPVDQANLLGDQYALFAAGRAPLGGYLDLVAALSHADEQNIAVWENTIHHLEALDLLERGAPSRPAFRKFALGVLSPELARLGWAPKPHESFLDALLRPEVILALGRFGDQQVIDHAERLFAASRQDQSALSPSLVGAVTMIVGMHANQKTWDELRGMGEKASDTEQKLRYFDAMAAARKPKLIAQSVAFATSGQVPNGRIVEYIGGVARHSDDPKAVWHLVQPDQAPIRAKLAPWSQTYLLPSIAYSSTDPALAQALLADPSSKESAGARIEAAKAANLIDTEAKLKQRAQPAIATWLKGR